MHEAGVFAVGRVEGRRQRNGWTFVSLVGGSRERS